MNYLLLGGKGMILNSNKQNYQLTYFGVILSPVLKCNRSLSCHDQTLNK